MSIRVLVVDDSRLARIVLVRTIRTLQPDWICMEATSGDDALAVFEVQDADVAILDFNMPGRNGLEIARELRSRYPRMPIAIVTANIQSDVHAHTLAAGAHFIPKPVDAEDLRPFLEHARAEVELGQ
jgi:CheY-like chemotaxis protein